MKGWLGTTETQKGNGGFKHAVNVNFGPVEIPNVSSYMMLIELPYSRFYLRGPNLCNFARNHELANFKLK